VRKVHHPTIAQRSDGQWIVVCEDCKRGGQPGTPLAINSPLESYEAAAKVWESHCERWIPPFPRDGPGARGACGLA
jgi:hypothetical protein